MPASTKNTIEQTCQKVRVYWLEAGRIKYRYSPQVIAMATTCNQSEEVCVALSSAPLQERSSCVFLPDGPALYFVPSMCIKFIFKLRNRLIHRNLFQTILTVYSVKIKTNQYTQIQMCCLLFCTIVLPVCLHVCSWVGGQLTEFLCLRAVQTLTSVTEVISCGFLCVWLNYTCG